MNPEFAIHPDSLIGTMYLMQLRHGGRIGGWHTAPPKDEKDLKRRMGVLRENHSADFQRMVELAKEVHDRPPETPGNEEWKDVPLPRHPQWYAALLQEQDRNHQNHNTGNKEAEIR